MVRTMLATAVLAVTLCVVPGSAMAGRTTVALRSSDLAVRESAEESYGDYFLIDVDVPTGIASESLLGAILEFYLDVDIRIDTVLVEEPDTTYTVVQRNPVPLIDVFALTSAPGQTLDPQQWDPQMAFPTPISTGTNKVVRIDITRVVNYYLEHPQQNHGLVVGSLTGRRAGRFSLRETFGTGVLARIRYVFFSL